MASHFGGESGHAGALQEDKDLRHGVRRSPVSRGLMTEHIHGQAWVEIELVEEQVVWVGRRRGEPEPELRADPLDRMVVRGSGKVVAFVDDHVPVPGGEVHDVGTPGQRGQHRDIHDTGELAPAAADLPRSYAEELLDA